MKSPFLLFSLMLLVSCSPLGTYWIIQTQEEQNPYFISSISSFSQVLTEACFMKGASEATLRVGDNYFVIINSNNSYESDTWSSPNTVMTTQNRDIYGNARRPTTTTLYGVTMTTEDWSKDGFIRTFKDEPKQYDELVKVYSARLVHQAYTSPDVNELCVNGSANE